MGFTSGAPCPGSWGCDLGHNKPKGSTSVVPPPTWGSSTSCPRLVNVSMATLAKDRREPSRVLLGLRRRVTILDDDGEVEKVLAKRRTEFRRGLLADPRVDSPERPAILDSPSANTFTIADEEVLAGTPATVARQIIDQCREVGAGHFLASFDRTPTVAMLMGWYASFGAGAIPLLRQAAV